MGIFFRLKPNQWALFWLLFSLGVLSSAGCGSTAASLNTGLGSTPLPTSVPVCALNENFYTATDGAIGLQNQQASLLANEIYNQYLKNPNELEAARNRAIEFLAYETKRWSHLEDVRVDDYNSVRVVATFLSPELIRAVLLNHALLNNLAGSNLPDFSNRVLATMDGQQKYLFLLAIQPVTNNQSQQKIHIPANQVVLINNGGMHVNVSNSDDFLNQAFDFTSSAHAGFLFYPFGATTGNGCKRVLDPLRDTSITLTLEAQFGDFDRRTITWEIPFAPPLPVSCPIPTPNPNLAFSGDKLPLSEAPSYDFNWETNPAYWRDWGRFVWGQVTFDHLALP